MRLLVGASLPTALPLSLAPVLGALSFLIVVLPLALPPMGPLYSLLLDLWVLFRLLLVPGLVSAPLPLVRLLVGTSLPIALLLLMPPLLLAMSFLAFLRLCVASAVACASAPGRSSAPCTTARGRFVAYRSAALGRSVVSYAWACGRSSALCATARGRFVASAIFPGGCATSSSAACGAALTPSPGLVGAPAPLVRLLAGAALPSALPLVMAALLCVLLSLAVVLPFALLLMGLRCLWFRPVCVLSALLAASLAPFLFESTLVSQCRLSAKAPRSGTLNDGSPSCRSAGGRPCTQVPRVYPRVAVPALRPGTRVADSDRRSTGSRALFEVSGPRSYLSPWQLPAMGIVPCCDSRLRGFGTLRESMCCAVGIVGRGWLRVRRPHPRPPTLAVHTGTVPLATILTVFRLVPGHGWGGAGGGHIQGPGPPPPPPPCMAPGAHSCMGAVWWMSYSKHNK